jgi:hypothetical protein
MLETASVWLSAGGLDGLVAIAGKLPKEIELANNPIKLTVLDTVC